MKVNSLEVIQSITTILQMRLDKFHNLLQMRLAKFYNPTMLKIDLGTNSSIRLICKLIKSLTKSNGKVHKPKTYDKVIDNLIYKNR